MTRPLDEVELLKVNVIDPFNKALREWQASTGCNVQFSWGFNQEGLKELKAREVTRSLYSEEATKEEIDGALETFNEAMEPITLRKS